MRILFIPVSGPHGSGELMRCLSIAHAVQMAQPDAEIHFLVASDAQFGDSIAFQTHHCLRSPTYCTPRVLEVLNQIRPDVAVFDNAGRSAQLRHAHDLGARTIFISRTPRLRRKAFRWRWMGWLNEHWIVFPRFITGGESWLERLKLRLHPHYRLRFMDTLFAPPDTNATHACLQQLQLDTDQFVLFLPGGGGDHEDARQAVQICIAAAADLHARTGLPTVVLSGSHSPPASPHGVQALPRISSSEVQQLLASARLVVCNGGTSLLHALAHQKLVVGLALRDDQHLRIRQCLKAGVIRSAPAESRVIVDSVTALLANSTAQQELLQHIERLHIRNALPEAVAAITALAASAHTA